jgi:hypothetical protein
MLILVSWVTVFNTLNFSTKILRRQPFASLHLSIPSPRMSGSQTPTRSAAASELIVDINENDMSISSTTISSVSTPGISNLASPDNLSKGKASVLERLSPPPVKTPYVVEDALDDLPGISYALEIFLASHMLEAEEYCHKSDPEKC